jgi:hypothetical protein
MTQHCVPLPVLMTHQQHCSSQEKKFRGGENREKCILVRALIDEASAVVWLVFDPGTMAG